jgi:hypothetical protein
MQTYEIAPDESMESLVRSLSRAARKDKDIVLVIPAGVNPFSGIESVSKLNGVLRSYDARLQVQAGDPSVVALFREAGLTAGPLEGAAGGSAPQIGAPSPAPLPAATAPAAPAARPDGIPEDLSNMNFDFAEVGSAPPREHAGPPPARPGGGGFLSKLKTRMTQPDAPAPPSITGSQVYARVEPAALPDWAAAMAPAADAPAMSSGLDATLPDWLQDAPEAPPVAGNRVVGRMPASNLDVTLPPGFGTTPAETGPVVGSPFGGAEPFLTAAPAAGAPAGAAALPDWLQAAAPQAPAVATAPRAAAPPPAVAPPVGFDLGAMGGPVQTVASVGAAVRAAGLDARTRALLLLGMALVRLAPGEARAAVAAARQAGCGDDDLRLVVEMAHALGGGPSERLGRKVLEG